MLEKRKNDIKFFDVKTGEVVCTYNQCCHKFTIEQTQEAISNPVVGYDANDAFVRKTVVSEVYFHKCSECGRKISNKNDRSKTFDNYRKSKYEQAWKKSPADTKKSPF